MRGKSVLVMFFQDWCPICNGWSPNLFKQIGEAYKDDPLVVLIAIKTDGGSTSDAENYLQSRTELEHWLVGVDDNATYYRQATGEDRLYKYMWVKPDGEVGEIDKSGTFLRDSNPRQFSLAAKGDQAKFRKDAKPLLPTEPTINEALKPAAWFAERGLFLTALSEVRKSASNSALQDDVATFRQIILEQLDASVKNHAATVADESSENRYQAYLALRKIEENFGPSAPGQAAKQAAAAHTSSAWVSDEEEAADDYESIMRRAARADDERSRDRITRALEKLAEEYPNTMYGRIAAASKSED
ncbi:MAG: hypothetical protein AAF585_05190 [Verrucomicrobiota bacterium]